MQASPSPLATPAYMCPLAHLMRSRPLLSRDQGCVLGEQRGRAWSESPLWLGPAVKLNSPMTWLGLTDFGMFAQASAARMREPEHLCTGARSTFLFTGCAVRWTPWT